MLLAHFVSLLSLLTLRVVSRVISTGIPTEDHLAGKANVTALVRGGNFSAANAIIDYRVEDTPIALKIELKPELPLKKQDLGRSLIQTQLQLRRYLQSHYKADQDVLFPSDDPYDLNKDLPGCYFAMTHWPPDRTKRLTYGMVDIILTGAIDVFWKGEKFMGADIYVVHDYMGMVGAGQLLRERPHLKTAMSVK